MTQQIHVGATYESHGTPSAPPDQHQWWWHSYPWWAYQAPYPWYGLQQQCYFDPWQGAWVCPSSPWAYQPVYQRWVVVPRAAWWGGGHWRGR